MRGIDEVGVSCLGDFEVSPFSNFVDERVNFLLGTIDELFKTLKMKNQESLEWSEEMVGSQAI